MAYGKESLDGMSKETKETILYGQLQEGLSYYLLRSPSVSGALLYKELCMATKNEERRQSELKKKQEYSKSGTRVFPKTQTSSKVTNQGKSQSVSSE